MSVDREILASEAGETGLNALTWVDEHGDALYAYALGRLGRADLAEDVVQETFLAALTARGRFQSKSSCRTWLIAILRRKIVDRYRKGETTRAAIGSATSPLPFFDEKGIWIDPPSPWKIPEEVAESEELRAALAECFTKLPDRLAVPFILREIDGLDTETIRKDLDLSAGNLRVMLHRARLVLRDCLDKNWFHGEKEGKKCS